MSKRYRIIVSPIYFSLWCVLYFLMTFGLPVHFLGALIGLMVIVANLLKGLFSGFDMDVKSGVIDGFAVSFICLLFPIWATYLYIRDGYIAF